MFVAGACAATGVYVFSRTSPARAGGGPVLFFAMAALAVLIKKVVSEVHAQRTWNSLLDNNKWRVRDGWEERRERRNASGVVFSPFSADIFRADAGHIDEFSLKTVVGSEIRSSNLDLLHRYRPIENSDINEAEIVAVGDHYHGTGQLVLAPHSVRRSVGTKSGDQELLSSLRNGSQELRDRNSTPLYCRDFVAQDNTKCTGIAVAAADLRPWVRDRIVSNFDPSDRDGVVRAMQFALLFAPLT